MGKKAKKKKLPLRMCIGCKQMKLKKELIRIVRTPEGDVLLDDTGKKSGRGAYLCNSVECLEKAISQKLLEKALKCSLTKEFFLDLRIRMED